MIQPPDPCLTIDFRALKNMEYNFEMATIYSKIVNWSRYSESNEDAVKADISDNTAYVWFIIPDEEIEDHFDGIFTLPAFQRYKAKLIEEGWLVTGDFLDDNGEKITLVRPDWDRFMQMQHAYIMGKSLDLKKKKKKK